MVGGKVEHGDGVALAAGDGGAGRQVVDHRGVEFKSAGQHLLGDKKVGEELADRAGLEHGVLIDRLVAVHGERAGAVEASVAVVDHGDGYADIGLVAGDAVGEDLVHVHLLRRNRGGQHQRGGEQSRPVSHGPSSSRGGRIHRH